MAVKFGIVVGKDNRKAEELFEKVSDYLAVKGQNVEKDPSKADVVITLGGDGTLIHAACEYAQSRAKFVGVNVGTLGFLTAVEVDGWQKAIDKLVMGDFVTSERMTIESHVGKETYRAVNEIVVKGMYRVVNLEIYVNGQKFLTCSGDGVIVATQTGSTAYSLSAGGPIVDPQLDCLVVTPVNAHGLPIPSVVLSPDDQIEIKLVEGEDVSLIIDGQEHTKIVMGQSVKVERGKYKVKLVYFDKQHFLKALNGKFGLAGRLTNE